MIGNKIDAPLVEAAQTLLTQGKKVVVLTHMGPDGDAMGSALAMRLWLLAGVHGAAPAESVRVIVPNAFPDFLGWMPGADEVLVYELKPELCNRFIDEADLLVCTDFNDPKRIGPAGERLLQKACPKLMIDHHLNPSDFADVTISYPDSPSASELVYRLMNQMNNDPRPVSLPVATCLYTGMMTDTGNFSYNSNYPEMYEIVGELVRAGVNKDEVYDRVFNQYSADRMRLMGYCLHRKMRLFPEHQLALITLSYDELQQYHYKQGDTEGIVNLPMQIANVRYSVFMREQPAKPGTPKPVIKISFRSQGDRPVNIMASEVFRGGGHKNAAGGEFYGSLQTATHIFLREYPKYLQKD